MEEMDVADVTLRLRFPFLYVLIGIHAFWTDKDLRRAAWGKCRTGFVIGAFVGLLWAVSTFKMQKKLVKKFIKISSRLTRSMSKPEIQSEIPINLPTFLTLGFQIQLILRFFLVLGIKLTSYQAWDAALTPRGTSLDFWQPYVEDPCRRSSILQQKGWDLQLAAAIYRTIIRDERERENSKDPSFKQKRLDSLVSWVIDKLVVGKVLLYPFTWYPLLGMLVLAATQTSRAAVRLHKPYFKAKKMTVVQQHMFMEDHKWDYRLFGFAAALLESIPIVGVAFTVSNRIGAAMWAHDLEQQFNSRQIKVKFD